MIHVTFLLKRHYLAEHHSWHFLSCCSFRRGISGSFFLSLLFSRSQVIIKKSSNDNCLGSNRGLRENIIKHQTLSFWTDKIIIWWLFNDGFRAREGESERKKEPQIPRLSAHSIFQKFLNSLHQRDMKIVVRYVKESKNGITI